MDAWFSLRQSSCCKCGEVGRRELSILSLKVAGDKESDFFLFRSLCGVELLSNGCLKKYSIEVCLPCPCIGVRSLTDFSRSRVRAVVIPSRKVSIFGVLPGAVEL